MDNFIHPYTPHKRIIKDAGETHKKLYSLQRDEHNNCIYKERGEVDIQAEVQSYREQCSLEAQLLRMQFAPVDTIVRSLHQLEPVSADLSEFPSDLMEYQLMLQRLRKDIPDFDNLVKTKSVEEIIKSLIPKRSDAENIIEIGGAEDGKNE